jgi:hypothetical protein
VYQNPELTKLHYDRQMKAREERERVREIKERGYSKEKGGQNERSISGGANSTRRS